MGLLKDVKDSQSQIENERIEQASELVEIRDELTDTRKREESERHRRKKEKKQFKERIESISQERTLKESELQAQLREKDSLLDSQRQ